MTINKSFFFSILILLILSCAFSQKISHSETKRKILFDFQNIQLLDVKEVEKLTGYDFMDITDYPNLNLGPVPKSQDFPAEPRKQSQVRPLLSQVQASNLEKKVDDFSAFFNRYYLSQTGQDVVNWLQAEAKKVISSLQPNRRPLFTVSTFTHAKFPQKSVIIQMKGKGSVANETVILGAHLDSINIANRTGRAPGSDDDASGCSVLLETFRILANAPNFEPERSIEFQFYAAEELGLLGSQDIAQAYKTQQRIVHSMMQLDMTGYVYRGSLKIGVAHDQFVSASLAKFVTQLVDEYTLNGWTESNCAHACSDHASFTRAGYRAIYPPSRPLQAGLNPHVHTINDIKENMNFTRMVEYGKLGISYIVELSSQ